jgi:hypothetical protein
MKIAVKYCGGCNPDYDRAAVFERIKNSLSEKYQFVDADEKHPDIVIAVQGCSVACADLSRHKGSRVYTIRKPQDAEDLIRVMRSSGD